LELLITSYEFIFAIIKLALVLEPELERVTLDQVEFLLQE
jgi:hypothetical protein